LTIGGALIFTILRVEQRSLARLPTACGWPTRRTAGTPLVRAATWLTHLDFDQPVWRHWLTGLGERNTVVRYDERGCGLSDRDVGELSVDTWVSDLEAVVDAAGLERFGLLGISQGAAIALVYAVRHPERVTDLVLYGGYLRGRKRRQPGQRDQQDALISAIRAGWSDPSPAFRRVFSMLYLPEGTPEQMAWYDELQRRSTSPDTAARLYDARRYRCDRAGAAGDDPDAGDAPAATASCRSMRAPDQRAGSRRAARPAGLGQTNLLSDEPAWSSFMSELDAFLGPVPTATPSAIEELSARARGPGAGRRRLTNVEIAQRLSLSVRTVERHLSNLYVKLRVSGRRGAPRPPRACSRRTLGPHAAARHGRAQNGCWRRCRAAGRA
jgi:pimeloyl-ACP methyl ester carboxylesterase